MKLVCKNSEGYNEDLFLLSSYVVIDYDFEVILPILELHMCSFNGCSLI